MLATATFFEKCELGEAYLIHWIQSWQTYISHISLASFMKHNKQLKTSATIHQIKTTIMKAKVISLSVFIIKLILQLSLIFCFLFLFSVFLDQDIIARKLIRTIIETGCTVYKWIGIIWKLNWSEDATNTWSCTGLRLISLKYKWRINSDLRSQSLIHDNSFVIQYFIKE